MVRSVKEAKRRGEREAWAAVVGVVREVCAEGRMVKAEGTGSARALRNVQWCRDERQSYGLVGPHWDCS